VAKKIVAKICGCENILIYAFPLERRFWARGYWLYILWFYIGKLRR
jgi:hypothetical protein